MIGKDGPKAIETKYAGHLFRSRLEARWAVFFDRMDIEWEYEAEAFQTSAGNYLPDFRIRVPQPEDHGRLGYQWFEVKPPHADHDERWEALATMTKAPMIVARGIPRSYAEQVEHKPFAHHRITVHLTDDDTWSAAAFVDQRRVRPTMHCGLGEQRHYCQHDWTDVEMHLAVACGTRMRLPGSSRLVDHAYAAAHRARFGT